MITRTVLLVIGLIIYSNLCSSKIKQLSKDEKQSLLLKTAVSRNSTLNVVVDRKNSTEDYEYKNCIYRIEDGDQLIGLNKTKEEIEKEGKIIFDQICEGDLDANGDKISSGALASLCCG